MVCVTQMWLSMPTMAIDFTPSGFEDRVEKVVVRASRSSGTIMLNAVLSMREGIFREVSSETVGPSREADWVVEKMGMERDWEARISL